MSLKQKLSNEKISIDFQFKKFKKKLYNLGLMNLGKFWVNRILTQKKQTKKNSKRVTIMMRKMNNPSLYICILLTTFDHHIQAKGYEVKLI